MTTHNANRDFAVDVVRQLQSAGYQAVWAGGCVRDQLLGLEPKDYDVATSAVPNEVRAVFGAKRTWAVGEAFGVIVVRGPRGAEQIEVATFRIDGGYSDGRRPDSVQYSSAKEDAERRDFTINGMFFDPLSQDTIDYVGGQQDLERRVVRAIGDPDARFGEDKLRMLRAVRFAAKFDFEIEPKTLHAIQRRTNEIHVVSGERIGMEMSRMLSDVRRRQAVQTLRSSSLLNEILPEANAAMTRHHDCVLAALEMLATCAAPMASSLACLLRDWDEDGKQALDAKKVTRSVAERWKMTNQDTALTRWLLEHESVVRNASNSSWPQVQRVLVHDQASTLLDWAEAIGLAMQSEETQHGVAFCRGKLALDLAVWNPTPLLDGNDLRKRGVEPRPIFKRVLNAVRDGQLNGEIVGEEEAWKLVEELLMKEER